MVFCGSAGSLDGQRGVVPLIQEDNSPAIENRLHGSYRWDGLHLKAKEFRLELARAGFPE